MAELSYPPWSAPSTMERERKKAKKMTEVKKKPWWKRSQRKPQKLGDRSALPPPPGQDKMSFPPPQPRYGEFSPFGRGREKINPLSGGGTPFLFQQLTGGIAYPYPPPMRAFTETPRYEKKDYQEEAAASPKGLFTPPSPKPSRPPLSNIFPMYDSPNLNKTRLQKTQSAGASKTPKHAPKVGGRRNSTPAVTAVPEAQRALKQRPSYTSAQSTTSDITYQRMARKRRASAIRALPTLPAGGDSQSSLPSTGKDTKEDDCTIITSPADVMYTPPPNLRSGTDKDPSMYGWSEQPHEQLQKLEEELDRENTESKELLNLEQTVKSEGPEGEEARGTMVLEKERKNNEPIVKPKPKPKLKAKSSKSKSAPKDDDQVTDFAEEFVRQLTLGGDDQDVLY